MFDDYILYHLEHMCCSEISDEILADLRGTPKVSSIGRDIILPSSRVSAESLAKALSPVEGPFSLASLQANGDNATLAGEIHTSGQCNRRLAGEYALIS